MRFPSELFCKTCLHNLKWRRRGSPLWNWGQPGRLAHISLWITNSCIILLFRCQLDSDFVLDIQIGTRKQTTTTRFYQWKAIGQCFVKKTCSIKIFCSYQWAQTFDILNTAISINLWRENSVDSLFVLPNVLLIISRVKNAENNKWYQKFW